MFQTQYDACIWQKWYFRINEDNCTSTSRRLELKTANECLATPRHHADVTDQLHAELSLIRSADMI